MKKKERRKRRKYKVVPFDEAQQKLVALLFSQDGIVRERFVKKDETCAYLLELVKRHNITGFSLSSIVACTILAQGDAIKSRLALLESLEIGKNEPMIEPDYIFTKVYPDGFYTDESAEENIEDRKKSLKKGWNKLLK